MKITLQTCDIYQDNNQFQGCMEGASRKPMSLESEAPSRK